MEWVHSLIPVHGLLHASPMRHTQVNYIMIAEPLLLTWINVRIIYYDNRDSPITVLPCMCITQETFINIVMSWYDHYCTDGNIFILSYLPCWSCIFFTIAFIMWKSLVCKFVLLMLNKFILVHKWFIWMVVICHVFYCILCCICIFTMYFVRNDKIKLWNQC